MAKKKRAVLKPVVNIFKIAWLIIFTIFQTASVGLYRNLRLNWQLTFNPEARKKLKRELEAEKMTKLLDDRIKTIERLVWSIFEDPEYSKSAKGKYDLKQLKKEVK